MAAAWRRIRDNTKDEHGAVLIFVAGSLLVLLGFVAFATDLGWFYLNTSHAQRTADAAAMAGVIRMPSDFPQATTDALEIAAANGFVDGVDGASVVVEEVFDDLGDQLPYQLQVTVSREVPAFFLNALGKSTETVTRSAVAEFIPPIPIGSRFSTIGNQAECNPQPNPPTSTCPAYWANIHGRHTDVVNGDAYSSRCRDGAGAGNDGNCAQNPTYRADGYAYGVEVTPGMNQFSIEFLDIEFHRNPNQFHRTGDLLRVGCPGVCGPSVRVTVRRPDATPQDPFNNPPVPVSDWIAGSCTQDYAPQPVQPASDPYVFDLHCTVDTTGAPGVYVVQIQVLDDTGTTNDDGAWNRYAMRATAPGPDPRLFGINEFSLFNNFSGSNTVFDLAEIASSYRGKELVIEMYDPGDVDLFLSNIIHIVHPNGADAPNCRVFWREEVTNAWQPWEVPNPSPCTIDATRTSNSDNFQGDWIRVEIDLPDTYNCDGGTPLNCWWQVRYQFGGAGDVHDTTTWRAFIEGNPVHLLPSG